MAMKRLFWVLLLFTLPIYDGFFATLQRRTYSSITSSPNYFMALDSTMTKTVISPLEKSIRVAIASKDVNQAIDAVSSLNSTALRSMRNVVFVVTETCRRTKSLYNLLPLLKSIDNSRITCVEDDLIPMLNNCIDASEVDIKHAYEAFLYLKDDWKIKFSAKTYSILFKLFGKIANLALTENLYELVSTKMNPIEADTILLNSIMDAFINCNEIDRATELFVYFMNNTTMAHSLSLLISPISKSSMNLPASWNVSPNTRTFNILLKGIRGRIKNNENLHEDFSISILWSKVLALMTANKLVPDSVTINTMVDMCALSLDFETGESILNNNMFTTAGIEAYTSLITGYASISNTNDSFRIFNSMKEKGIMPNSVTLSSLIYACVKGKKFNLAQSLLDEYPEFGKILYCSYVTGLSGLVLAENDASIRSAYIRESTRALFVMEKEKLLPDLPTLNTFINALCAHKVSNIDTALLIYTIMLKLNIHPDDYTYSILFTALGRVNGNYVDLTLAIFDNSPAIKDLPAINAFLRASSNCKHPLLTIDLFDEIFAKNATESNSALSGKSQGKFIKDAVLPDKLTFSSIFLSILRQITTAKRDSNKGNSPNLFQLLESKSVPFSSYLQQHDIEKVMQLTSRSKQMSHHSTKDIDKLLRKFYRMMRYDYNIVPDDVLLRLFTTIFTEQSKQSKNVLMPPTITMETAKLILEDLIISGWEPNQLIPILTACQYPLRQQLTLLEDPEVVKKLRISAASSRIFRKYGWNKVESSFSSLGF